ncbi:MAG TPA: hypothetical protein VGP19_08910 [Candidatus Acidoferrales bacterium]|jgi:hypothetical protein|nr:hypothetical protein [Candidatus Acidoferrales bacterium]
MKRSDDIRSIVHQLNALAVKGLVPMFDPQRQLFCHKLKRTAAGLVQEGISHRYTAITLMGLRRLEQSGVESPIEIDRVVDVLLADTKWVDNIGDLGLLLWLSAQVAPDRLDELESRLDLKTALNRFRDARQHRSMELSWFLTGLSYQVLARPEKLAGTKDLALETYRRIVRNQGKEGIFGHSASNEGLSGMLRSGIGSFADQVYPIYAMTKYSQAFGDDKAIKRAMDCAITICEAQGSLGQWWWHYDSSNGRVAESFPVFSVHQHAMGPMTLLALGEAVQSDFSPWIYKGLQWIDDNELGIDMKDNSANVVWRCIERTRPNRVWNAAVNLITRREDRESRNGLRTLFECRPYELGWLLYAFANWNRS